MADRLLALIGKGVGPMLDTRGLRNPKVVITGLKQGDSVLVETEGDPHSFDECGGFEIPETQWLKVSADGVCKTLVCQIVGDR